MIIRKKGDFDVFIKYSEDELIRSEATNEILSAEKARSLLKDLEFHIRFVEENASGLIAQKAIDAFWEYMELGNVTSGLSGFIYLGRSKDGATKIGFSKNPEYRTASLSFNLIFYRQGTMANEAAMHYAFGSRRIDGEYFNLSDDDIKTADLILRDIQP